MERLKMVAPCGIDCGICELYVCKDNPEIYEYLIGKGISKESLPCFGCRSMEGNCPVISKTCETYQCITGKKLDFCSNCEEFPCGKLHPSADRANVLPHNLKLFNLCTIENFGLEYFVENSQPIKHRYFNARMIVGSGPKL